MSLDRTECIDEFVNCVLYDGVGYTPASPEDYVKRIYSNYSFQEWSCPACDYGFYWDENQWDCTGVCINWHLEALDCNEFGIFECTEEYMVSPDSLTCLPKIENCDDLEDQPESLSASDDLTYYTCPDCDDYYMWNDNTHTCD